MGRRSLLPWTMGRLGLLALSLSVFGCATPAPEPFDLSALPSVPKDAEPMPPLEVAESVPRVLVLPLADRAVPNPIGRIHNAVDDLLRRDLMRVPHLSVFSSGAYQVGVREMYAPSYHTLDTGVAAGNTAGATHVVFGEIASREDQVAIEVDIVDVTAGRVVQSFRVQDVEKRMQRRIQELRESVLAWFLDSADGAPAIAPGVTPSIGLLKHVGYGQNYRLSGDLSQALIEFYAALERKEPFADVYWGIAETQADLGAPDLAALAYTATLTDDPDHVEPYWRYALLRIRAGSHEAKTDALRLCQAALRRAPYFGPAHLTLGTLWFEERQYAHADRHFALAGALLPGSVWPLYNHANVLQAQGDVAGARRALEKALRVAPQNARVNADYGLLLSELGEHEAALAALRRAADLDRRNALYLYYVGQEYDHLGYTHEALTAYRAAAAYTFNHPSLHRQLGHAFVEHDQLKDAEQILAAGYGAGHQEPALVLLFSDVLLDMASRDRIRRRDYATRARNMLEGLLSMELAAEDRAQAQVILERAEALLR